MADLQDFTRVAANDNTFCIVATTRADGTVQASVVNAGVSKHPSRGDDVLGFVAIGGSRKLANLRARPHVTVVARAGGAWVAVEGRAELVGPDDPVPGVDVPSLLRDVFVAAGGSHDDWDEYDRVMAEQRRTAVFITPARVYGNG